MTKIRIWVITSLIIIVLSGILVFLTPWDKEVKNHILDYTTILITVLALFIALYQLKIATRKYFDDIQQKADLFLDMKVQTKQNPPFYSIKTKVSNSIGVPKRIRFAFLLISRQNDSIINVVNNVCINQNIQLYFQRSNDFYQLKEFVNQELFIDNNIGLIPLRFYFSENVQISNESPGFTYTFNNIISQLNPDIYSVRFFIYRENGFHRSTSDTLIIY